LNDRRDIKALTPEPSEDLMKTPDRVFRQTAAGTRSEAEVKMTQESGFKKVSLPMCMCGYKFEDFENMLDHQRFGYCYCPQCNHDLYSVWEVEAKIRRAERNGYFNRYYRVEVKNV